ncbi:hypothetical protein [Streptomyces sp. DSM 40750]|uniref:hypothetical protein n=1 Tax=Streptomyces sp. DSM 40750 TaxID=2801030 RepID=UPI00214C624B|nr:hypothetical protein [Streptomyces sp. DSM 40750]UUU21076.1 hypothetical protein JIX55_12595 [Streptomyces sp. DSM 40750]
MPVKPSQYWRTETEKETHAVSAGTMDPESASFLGVYSESFLNAVDAALTNFESDVRELAPTSDAQVLAAVERVVLALNRVNQEETGGSIDTDEREQICLFIDEALTEHGIDVGELAARQQVSRYAITDRWREW